MKYFGWGAIALVMLGAVLFASAQAAVERTNSISFCTSCHEMRDNNYAEYRDTIHARNRTGVVATCSDCHVPHGAVELVLRKIGAANDLVQHLAGKIDTREKFQAHRLEMAEKVWRRMESTDSRECRGCHDAAAMDPEKQGTTARRQHLKLADHQRTCIDCHYGIAHQEPEGDAQPRDLVQ